MRRICSPRPAMHNMSCSSPRHHDGFCLWPSDVENTHEAGWVSKRDIVGELGAAVRARRHAFRPLLFRRDRLNLQIREPLRTMADFMSSSTPGGGATRPLPKRRPVN